MLESQLEIISEDAPESIYAQSNLTQNQLLFWIGQRFYPETPLFNMLMNFTIHGVIDSALFEEAYQHVVDQADIMRTIITDDDGVPRQIVQPQMDANLLHLDFSAESNPQAAYEQWTAVRCKRPFLLHDRLFDSALIKLADDKFVWYQCMHHIVVDALAMSLIYQRTAEQYAYLASQAEQPATTFPPYIDYINYERQTRLSNSNKKAESYWEKELATKLPPLNIFGKKPFNQISHCERVEYSLGVERTAKLRDVAKQKGIFTISPQMTTFNILAAALYAYLFRVTGNSTLALGTPFHNRVAGNVKEMIGLFMEVFPLRIEIDENDSLKSINKKIFAKTRRMLQHHQFTTGNPVHNRAYDILLNYRNLNIPSFAGLPVTPSFPRHGYSDGHDHLTVQVYDVAGHDDMIVNFDFNIDIFEGVFQQEAIEGFTQILDGFLADPTQPLSQIGMLSDRAQQQVLVEFNQTAVSLPSEKLTPALITAQAQKHPEKTAAVYEDKRLTYAQLNARANQLAHFLQANGVGPEQLVGVFINRSIDMVVAAVAIIKAGGAYMPLDTSYPEARLSHMINDSGATWLLTQEHLVPNLPDHQANVLCLDTAWEQEISQQPTNEPPIDIVPTNTAYVIYTSGSTGKPKGVAVTHQGIPNLAECHRKVFQVHEDSHVLQFAAFGFDASVSELFVALLNGATLVLAPQEQLMPGPELQKLVAKQQVTVVTLPPSALAIMDPADFRSLRSVISAGEACTAEVAAKWSPNRNFVNGYGPTEATVCATMATIEKANGTPHIGGPMDNVEIYLLDKNLLPVPVGVPGELHISSVGLARGYINRHSLTAAKFIPNPFSNKPGARLYKSGDLARYRPDGNIEFLGRIDHQVKIRGYRIELGEIESTLSQHDEVQDVTVIVREDVPGEKQIVAYIIPVGEMPTLDNLRGYLKERIPEYMVPAAFVSLEQFPLTPNGKVDRKALPAPSESSLAASGQQVEPRDLLEFQLRDIWQRVLHLGNIGVRDDFFELGGSSLRAMRLFLRIEELTGQYLPLATLLEHGTIEKLAALLRSKSKQGDSAVIMLQKGAVGKRPLFILPGAGGNGLAIARIAQHLAPSQPVYTFLLPNMVDEQKSYDYVEDMAAFYKEALQSVDPEGPYLLCGYSTGSIVAFEVAQQLVSSGSEVQFLGVIDAATQSPNFRHLHNTTQRLGRLINLPSDRQEEMFLRVRDFLFTSDYVIHGGYKMLLGQQKGRLKRIFVGNNATWTNRHGEVIIGKSAEELADQPLLADADGSQMEDKKMRDVYEINNRAVRLYVPKMYQGQVTLFKTTKRSHGRVTGYSPHADLGWGKVAARGVATHIVDCAHIDVVKEPYVQQLSNHIQSCLNRIHDKLNAAPNGQLVKV